MTGVSARRSVLMCTTASALCLVSGQARAEVVTTFEMFPHGLEQFELPNVTAGRLTPDGRAAAFYGGDGERSFVWREGTGPVEASGLCSSFTQNFMPMISDDGRFIFGNAWTCEINPNNPNAGYMGAAVSEPGLDPIKIGYFPGGGDFFGDPSLVADASSDGSVFIGTSIGATDPLDIDNTAYTHAFRWTAAGGLVNIGGTMPNWTYSRGVACSGDGTKVLITGSENVLDEFGEVLDSVDRAVIWTAQGTTIVPPPPGFTEWAVGDMSSDGQRVIGRVTVPGNLIRVYLWDATTGHTLIPVRPDINLNSMRGWTLSANGQYIGGQIARTVQGHDGTAFIWDAVNGTRLVRDIVTAAGGDLGTWSLSQVTGISDDGLTLIGSGSYRVEGVIWPFADAWRVTTRTICRADLDNGTSTGTPDGGVDINDLLFFLTEFEAGSVSADLDNGSGTGTTDGGVDINDLLYFLVRFEAGC